MQVSFKTYIENYIKENGDVLGHYKIEEVYDYFMVVSTEKGYREAIHFSNVLEFIKNNKYVNRI